MANEKPKPEKPLTAEARFFLVMELCADVLRLGSRLARLGPLELERGQTLVRSLIESMDNLRLPLRQSQKDLERGLAKEHHQKHRTKVRRVKLPE